MSISTQTHQSAQRDFQRIPGVGPSIAGDFWLLGYRAVADLRGENPETMYRRFCELTGGPVDRCMLYVFRCAVYYASNDLRDPELLKWWNWSDQHLAARGQLQP